MQLALGLAGAALGSLAGPGALFLGLSGSSIGWAVGSMLGGSLQTQRVQGPRLSDLKLTSSSYGAPVPHVYGHPRIGGQVVWGSDRREIATTTSRRASGPKVKTTTYTYEIDLLIKLTSNEAPGVARIFANGELQWSAATGADAETLAGSEAFATRVTVYDGNAAQLPDPTYEAAVGVGNAPAYRGCLTVMIEGLQLGNSGAIPALTFELSTGLRAEGFETLLLAHYDDDTDSSAYARIPVKTMGGGYPVIASDPVSFGGLGLQFSASGSPNYWTWNGPFLGSTTADYTLEFWAEVSGSDAGYIAGRNAFVRVNNSDGSYFEFSSNSSVSNSFTVRCGGNYACGDRSQRTYFAIVRIAGETRLYCNDQYVNHRGSSVPYDINSIVVGDQVLTFYTVGGIVDEMRLTRGGRIVWQTGWVPYYSPTGAPPTDAPFSPNTSSTSYLTESVPLADVVQELCEQAGILASQIDVSALTGDVAAYAISPSTRRSALEVLMRAYAFDAASGDRLRFVPRGGAPVATIPWNDLGTVEAGGEPAEPLPIAMRNDLELPAYVTVRYSNVSDDYQDGSARSGRLATWSNAESVIELPLGLAPAEAQHIADVAAREVQTALMGLGPLQLQQRWSALQPADVVLVTDGDGMQHRMRIERRDAAAGIFTVRGVMDDALAVDGAGITDTDYTPTTIIRAPEATTLLLLDIPLLRDVDDDLGYYAAIRNLGAMFSGAALYRSTDDVAYSPVGNILTTGVVGTTLTALAAHTGGHWPDERNVVRVNVGAGVALSSITWAEAVSEEGNAWLIGDEILIARDAVYVSDGVYDLRGLSRGRRGTEWAMSAHVAAERAVLLQLTGLRRIPGEASELTLLRYHRAVTYGMQLDSAATVALANTAMSAKPLAPVDAVVERSGGNVTINWGRRTRKAENWLLGSTPLGESVEAWEIVRYTSNTFGTVAATYTSSTSSVTFANTDPAVYVDIYQLSDRVGRGYPLRATL